ncbi:hypothetical protein BER36_002228 [Clostridioides difficile]|nr:hypothetical protein BER36_002228 [Clostridioides difficile]
MLKVINVSKSYKNKKVVSSVSFDVNDGELFGFIGHNGAGKTTTIKAIVGIHDFEEGEVLINSKSIKNSLLNVKRKWHIYLIIQIYTSH